MPAQTILLWLAIIWVGAALLGLALHIIKLLLIAGFVGLGVRAGAGHRFQDRHCPLAISCDVRIGNYPR